MGGPRQCGDATGAALTHSHTATGPSGGTPWSGREAQTRTLPMRDCSTRLLPRRAHATGGPRTADPWIGDATPGLASAPSSYCWPFQLLS